MHHPSGALDKVCGALLLQNPYFTNYCQPGGRGKGCCNSKHRFASENRVTV